MRRLLLLFAFPCALSAQPTASISPFVAWDQSMSTRPLLIGFQTTISYAALGIRFGGSAAHASWQRADTATAAANQTWRAFAGDLDMMFNPGRKVDAGFAAGSLEPSLFAGIGVRAEVLAAGEQVTHNVVSLGSILRYSILRQVSLDVEARRLAPVNAVQDLFESGRGGWEYRAGLSFHFGSGPKRPTVGASSGGSRVASPQAAAVLSTADRLVGTRYVWGGSSPDRGFDCSGFVQYVFSNHGVRLPRTSREMALVGKSAGTNVDALQHGDLMFFAENGGRISHVAIYAGNNRIVHSSSSGKGVRYDDLATTRGHWFRRNFVSSQRVLGVSAEAMTIASESIRNAPPPANARAYSRKAQTNVGAFARAAGMTELSDVAKRLYRPDEKPDAPDSAPPAP